MIWHVLRPLSASDLRHGTPAAPGAQARRGREHHRRGRRDVAGHRGGQHARRQRAVGRRGHGAADAGGAAPADRAGPLDPAGAGWPTDPTLGETVRDIGSCTVGLVGYGNIARRVEADRVGDGRRRPVHTSTSDDGTAGWRPLPDLLAEQRHRLAAPAADGCDHRAARPRRAGGDEARTRCWSTPLAGAIVDEPALVDALRAGGSPLPGLDVFAVEPVAPDNPLLALDNVVLTPHVTWYTADTMRRYLDGGRRQLRTTARRP